jgi:hypothetical protein
VSGGGPVTAERRSGFDRRQGERRRIGRPPIAEDPSQLPAVRCSGALHDRVFRASLRRSAERGMEVTIAQTVRELLADALDRDEASPVVSSAPRNSADG